MKYIVIYKKEPSFQENNLLNSNAPWHEKKDYIEKNFVPLAVADAANLDALYYHFQAEIWSPNGEARPLIRALKLSHTSMSVGDLIFCPEDSTLYEVARSEFNIIARNAKIVDFIEPLPMPR